MDTASEEVTEEVASEEVDEVSAAVEDGIAVDEENESGVDVASEDVEVNSPCDEDAVSEIKRLDTEIAASAYQKWKLQ